MKGRRIGVEPATMLAWHAQEEAGVWHPSYPLPSDVRTVVTAELKREQRGLCVYCGRELKFDRPGHTFHIEHFRPRRNPYSHLSTAYANLFLSCGQFDGDLPSRTCGRLKEDWFDAALVVEPEYPACTRRFHFKLKGEVVPSDPADLQADQMIKRLGLNDSQLRAERKELLLFVDDGALEASDFWDDETGMAGSLGHVAYQHLGLELP